jgi:CDP-paratose 2-epimerase
LLAEYVGRHVEVSFGVPRPGDQVIYVSDIRKAMRDFGWQPRVPILEGSALLHGWISENHELFDFLLEGKGTRTDVESTAHRIQSATA